MRRNALVFLLLITIFAAVGCGRSIEPQPAINTQPISAESSENSTSGINAEMNSGNKSIELTSRVTELAEGLSFGGAPFGCSTFSAVDPEGNHIFLKKCSVYKRGNVETRYGHFLSLLVQTFNFGVDKHRLRCYNN